MAERAAHLVDRVLPDVPVRQWVLSVPYRLRYPNLRSSRSFPSFIAVSVDVSTVLSTRAARMGVR